jgi:hypothetical protein
MKKLVVAMLMVVMLAVPCMAEVEPDWFLGIENTIWGVQGIVGAMGFQGGKMYACYSTLALSCYIRENSFYIDLPGVAFVFYDDGYGTALLFSPLAWGVLFIQSTTPVWGMFKASDLFTPPS